MQTASHTLKPADLTSKLDPTNWSRELWRSAFAMARRIIHGRGEHSGGERLIYYRDAAIRRFGGQHYGVIWTAGVTALASRSAPHGATGAIEELLRQGWIRRTRRPRPGNLVGVVATRCARFERVRPLGINFAWTEDPLLTARAVRTYRARQLREHRAATHASARAAAAVIAAEQVGVTPRYALTVVGRLLLAEHEAKAQAHV